MGGSGIHGDHHVRRVYEEYAFLDGVQDGLHHLLVLAQAFLGPLAFRYVREGGYVVRDVALCVPHRGGGAPDRKFFAAPVPVPDFTLPHAGVPQGLLHGGAGSVVLQAGAQHVGSVSQGLFRPVTSEFGKGVIDAEDAEFGIGNVDALLGFEGGGGDAQFPFGFLEAADVCHESIPQGGAIRIPLRQRVHLEPFLHPLHRADAVFAAPRREGTDRFLERLEKGVPIVRMEQGAHLVRVLQQFPSLESVDVLDGVAGEGQAAAAVRPHPVLEDNAGHVGDDLAQAGIHRILCRPGFLGDDGGKEIVEGAGKAAELVVMAHGQGLAPQAAATHGLQQLRCLPEWGQLPPQPPPGNAAGQQRQKNGTAHQALLDAGDGGEGFLCREYGLHQPSRGGDAFARGEFHDAAGTEGHAGALETVNVFVVYLIKARGRPGPHDPGPVGGGDEGAAAWFCDEVAALAPETIGADVIEEIRLVQVGEADEGTDQMAVRVPDGGGDGHHGLMGGGADKGGTDDRAAF